MTKRVLPPLGCYLWICLLYDRWIAPRAAFCGQISTLRVALGQGGRGKLPPGAFAAEVTV